MGGGGEARSSPPIFDSPTQTPFKVFCNIVGIGISLGSSPPPPPKKKKEKLIPIPIGDEAGMHIRGPNLPQYS